jgi:DNA-directed RNA polymerase subunit beta'
MVQTANDFNAIQIGIASPEHVRSWSYGQVTKPETINYRTLRPERDGLFCERIFGPTKDWECSCGKYKKIRFRGIKCERCGVEVTRAKVRRERMGHIELAAPVAHIWFSKGIPSRLGLLLDLSPRNLERVLYFAQYIVTSVDEQAYNETLEEVTQDYQSKLDDLDQRFESKKLEISLEGTSVEKEVQIEVEEVSTEASEEGVGLLTLTDQLEQARAALHLDHQTRLDELQDLQPRRLMVETRYRELAERYPFVFQAQTGAEAVLTLLQELDLEPERVKLIEEMRSTSGQRRKKAVKRLRLVEAFRKSNNLPEWMILRALPVLPPDLRPMVQLDGGRFATSDLNDLYRRVINRNNRLRRLMDLEAPEIIIRNEKRMLQEAVDALIDNGRRGRAISGSHNHKLKSLSDLLRGKQGRFRQNLLGKRVDYSGRSVIVVGPELRMDQCGLPKRMALELFKPFVMHRLVINGLAHNIKSAKRMVERVRPEVWDILEEVIRDRPVFLNRAPTLHRLGIQAFMPVLIEGSAIQVHPLVCTAFNADFDGDQMAVHVPLSKGALQESEQIMLSARNMLSPASGEPTVAPTLDMVLGCYYLTSENPNAVGAEKRFSSSDEAELAYESGFLELQAPIAVLGLVSSSDWVATTLGRLLFRNVLPDELTSDMTNWNRVMNKDALKNLVSRSHGEVGNGETARMLDRIKEVGFHYATLSGITIAINDLEVSKEKGQLLMKADSQVQQLQEQYQRGLISERERHEQVLGIWEEASQSVTEVIEASLDTFGGIYMMATSGAKGNISQIKQMAGMRGLMSDPKGRLIEVPVTSSFREGLTVLEYFISTHGARKGLADTALRTADSGYLTRRMIDVAQDVICFDQDCGTMEGTWIRHDKEKERNNFIASFAERLVGRVAAKPVANPATGEIIIDSNATIDSDIASQLWDAGVVEAFVRSPLTCGARRGICQLCYGTSLATGQLIAPGEAAGIIAAQSIGEPGTQLTMRTFHTGGVAGVDITSGIPRVEELLEARIPKTHAILSEIDGAVEVEDTIEGRKLHVVTESEYRDEYVIPDGFRVSVKNGVQVEANDQLARPVKRGKKPSDLPSPVLSAVSGRVHVGKDKVSVTWLENDDRMYLAPQTAYVVVKTGDQVFAGQELTAGLKNPHDILRIQGKEALQAYIIEEIQKVYRSQGVSINDKHVETIVRQMLRKIRVDHPGDSELLPGEPVDRFAFDEINRKILNDGGDPARGTALLLGITRASLSTDSFLAAASFQETTRVLTEAAVLGMVDRLEGLKENVIIGRLIPARSVAVEQYRSWIAVEANFLHSLRKAMAEGSEEEQAALIFGPERIIPAGKPVIPMSLEEVLIDPEITE